MSYGAEYGVPAQLFGSEARVYAGVDASYRSHFSSNPSRSAYTEIAGYLLVNLRAGVRVGGYEVFGWVRNALDTGYFEVLATQTGNTGLIVGQPDDPRTFGGTLRRFLKRGRTRVPGETDRA